MANYNHSNRAFTEDYYDQQNRTVTNGEATIPICFCIDTSGSMRIVTNRPHELEYRSGSAYSLDGVKEVRNVRAKPGYTLRPRIGEVKRVLKEMIRRMKSNPRLANAAVICIITFDEWSGCRQEFTDPYRIRQNIIDNIDVGEDITNASRGIDMALNHIDRYRTMNSQAGNDSYRPVLIFMSDGNVRNDPNASAARNEVRRRSEENRLNVIPIGIGKQADEAWMSQLSKDGIVYHMEHNDDFDRVFDNISQWVANVTSFLAADEGLAATMDELPVQTREDEVNTAYVTQSNEEDLESFFDDVFGS